MRIIKILLTSVVVLGMLAVISFLTAREVFLFMAVQQVKDDLQDTARRAYQTVEYKTLCREKGLIEETELIKEVRLRFDSDVDYQTEVVCTQFSLEAIPVKVSTLPYWVKKVPGQSGLVWLADKSGISLEIWGRQKDIYLTGNEFVYQPLAGTLDNPKTSCSGYGYSCCQIEDSLGQGEQLSQVTDCPQSCFQTCLARPVILSVNTDPVFEPQSRVLNVRSGQAVSFNVVADTRENLEDQALASYMIDYGDGHQENLSVQDLPFVHTYSCPTGGCRYQVTIQVINSQNIDSAMTPTSQLQVIVN